MNLVIKIKSIVSRVGGQQKLATMCGVTQPAVNKWTKGGLVSPENVRALVEASGGELKDYDIRPDVFPRPDKAA